MFGNPAEISSHLVPHPAIRLITFTGSVPVGKHLAALAGQHMKPAIMELGGHGPVIVCDDADPIATATEAALIQVSQRRTGMRCAPTRFFVHERLYDAFTRTFAETAMSMKIRQRP